MCPDCGSDRIRLIEFHFGICSQTGYHDCGEYFRCVDCGATGDPDELSIGCGSIPADGAEFEDESVKLAAGQGRDPLNFPVNASGEIGLLLATSGRSA